MAAKTSSTIRTIVVKAAEAVPEAIPAVEPKAKAPAKKTSAAKMMMSKSVPPSKVTKKPASQAGPGPKASGRHR